MCAENYEEPDEEKVVLAERRSKEHWSLDPRNTFWSNGRLLFPRLFSVYQMLFY